MKLILWEIWSYAHVPLVWWLFRRFARREIFGDILAGAIVGTFVEFTTEPLWDYHFHFTVYKDIAPSIPLGWGVMFALVVFVSEKLYCKILSRDSIAFGDKRLFLFDLLAGLLIGVPGEWVGLKSGLWDYRYDRLNWDWGMVPVINMPYEALFGYALLMLVAPTFVRYWQGSFEGNRHQDGH